MNYFPYISVIAFRQIDQARLCLLRFLAFTYRLSTEVAQKLHTHLSMIPHPIDTDWRPQRRGFPIISRLFALFV
jgi:hypothetical protein